MPDRAVYTDLHPGLRRTIHADLVAMARLKGRKSFGMAAAIDVLTLPGTWAVILFRLGSAAHHAHLRPVSRLLYFLNVVLFSVDINPAAVIAPGMAIGHPVGITIGGNVTIGPRVVLTGQVGVGGGLKRQDRTVTGTVVGSDVVFFYRAIVLADVTIGDGAVIGANSTVLQDVPPRAVVIGNPARVRSMRDEMPFENEEDWWRDTWQPAAHD
ncbi:MAG: serine O-acetyltransferase [Frankiaceae bacterium]|nr:serine O-acetyltransferase [Frankiaceae bacterium]